jgi:hypothetical protein
MDIDQEDSQNSQEYPRVHLPVCLCFCQKISVNTERTHFISLEIGRQCASRKKFEEKRVKSICSGFFFARKLNYPTPRQCSQNFTAAALLPIFFRRIWLAKQSSGGFDI